KAAIARLENRYLNKLQVNPDLTRSLVSFQSNKSEPIFRWFNYREGFSRPLIEYILEQLDIPENGCILDPFAGTGAAAFVGSQYRKMNSYAIELLPVGVFFMKCRNLFATLSNEELIDFARAAIDKRQEWLAVQPHWQYRHLRITHEAFPEETEKELSQYKTWIAEQEPNFALFLDFVAFSILEKISFTRKDGQYLRWDHRANRFQGSKHKSKFDKGKIWGFFEAVEDKFKQIVCDLETSIDLFSSIPRIEGEAIHILQGSVFQEIEKLSDNSLDCIVTSPPYCNRYDYTRTYALELAYLGVDESGVRTLRQSLLTCTVENKPKQFSDLPNDIQSQGELAFHNQDCLQNAIRFLESESSAGRLNNQGIVTMVKGYFYDSAIHLAQASKKLKHGGYYVMVNDNVRYNGLELPVDLILSDIASEFNLNTESIWVLPRGKGNSSQQMKRHGRAELRKCIYIWKKC
ncbi:MAG: restriction endonuclease, partial [Spirulinaceae cyanobacterium RM2_2_10]|nr:restriction endonuclease [Spirulinaceae cyanobacterium RM2_2_10]